VQRRIGPWRRRGYWNVGGADSDAVSRLLGDLGVDVLKIEWLGGAPLTLNKPIT
jgi:hypothetical protein